MQEEIESDDIGSLSLNEYINSFKFSLKGEEKFISENDWTTDISVSDRKLLYELQEKFVLNILSRADEIIKKTKGDLSETSESIVKRLSDLGEIHKDRIQNFIKGKDWASKFDIKDIKSFASEGEFIADLNISLEKIKKRLSKIKIKDFEFEIPVKKGQMVSLPMMHIFLKQFPELVTVMEAKEAVITIEKKKKTSSSKAPQKKGITKEKPKAKAKPKGVKLTIKK